MKLSLKKLHFTLFLLMIFSSSVPYALYALRAIQYRVKVSTELFRFISQIPPSLWCRAFVYVKDVATATLILLLLPFMRKKDLSLGLFVLCYGFIGLVFNGKTNPLFVVAGLRTFMFIIAVCCFFRQYALDKSHLLLLLRAVEIAQAINFVILIRQMLIVDGRVLFFTGYHRYSGAFAGAGNLAFFNVAVLLFSYLLDKKYKLLKPAELVVCSVLCLFCSTASGTRAAIFLIISMEAYIVIDFLFEKYHLSQQSKIPLFFASILLFMPYVISVVTEGVGRGSMAISGAGRFLLTGRILSQSPLAVLIGQGIGFGTNASIILKLPDSFISDSTINLLLNQFGLIGLTVFIFFFAILFYHMMRSDRAIPCITWMAIIVLFVLMVVGNLFEQIAMTEIYFSVLFLNLQTIYPEQVSKRVKGGADSS